MAPSQTTVDMQVHDDEQAPNNIQGGAPEERSTAQHRVRARGYDLPLSTRSSNSSLKARFRPVGDQADASCRMTARARHRQSTSPAKPIQDQGRHHRLCQRPVEPLPADPGDLQEELHTNDRYVRPAWDNRPGPRLSSLGWSPRATGWEAQPSRWRRGTDGRLGASGSFRCGNDIIGKGRGTLNDVDRERSAPTVGRRPSRPRRADSPRSIPPPGRDGAHRDEWTAVTSSPAGKEPHGRGLGRRAYPHGNVAADESRKECTHRRMRFQVQQMTQPTPFFDLMAEARRTVLQVRLKRQTARNSGIDRARRWHRTSQQDSQFRHSLGGEAHLHH